MADSELSRNERRVLLALSKKEKASPDEVMRDGEFSELVEVMSAASWLKSKGLVDIHEKIDTSYTLDREGELYVKRGELPEFTLLKALKGDNKHEMGSLQASGLEREAMQIALGWMRRKEWVSIQKEGGKSIVSLTEAGKKRQLDGPETEDMKVLKAVAGAKDGLPETEANAIGAHALSLLLTRKGLLKVKERYIRTLSLTENGRKVAQSGLSVGEEITQLTPEILQSGKWLNADFRPYDVGTFAPLLHGGKAHPLREAIARIRNIFLHMGFTEIHGNYVESCFWNMDALFIPQDHSARDLQDTYYLKDPATAEVPAKLAERIKVIHENGGNTGSEGWKYKWSIDDAKKTVLRTHTTASTIRYLSEHPEPPIKVFSVGKVFRREATDAKHLSEFFQIEGIVMEEGADLQMLIGLITEFFKRMGFPELRIQPSYYPYTEPSLDVQVKYQGKWMELGGAGIFRPEVTAPFEIKHPVLAWGLGLERLVMQSYKLPDIRLLYMGDLDWMRKTPLL